MGVDDSRWIRDRIEIDDLLTRYARAVDTCDWDLLATVFTPDAELDYRSAGGIRGRFPEVSAWLAQVLPGFSWTQHLVVNRSVTLDVDGATGRARSDFLNPNQFLIRGEPWLFTVGGRYHDRLVRSPNGWRIARRVEETVWWEHPPPGLGEVPPPMPDDTEL